MGCYEGYAGEYRVVVRTNSSRTLFPTHDISSVTKTSANSIAISVISPSLACVRSPWESEIVQRAGRATGGPGVSGRQRGKIRVQGELEDVNVAHMQVPKRVIGRSRGQAAVCNVWLC